MEVGLSVQQMTFTLMPFGRYFVSRRQIMPAIMETTLEQQQIPNGGTEI